MNPVNLIENHNLGSLIMWWRKWATMKWPIAGAAVFAVFILASSLISDSQTKFTSTTLSFNSTIDDLIPLTILKNARLIGAYCLDGSKAGYHFQEGFGSGSQSWLLHIEGGGWCNTKASCRARKRTKLGSVKFMEQQVQFSGILSRDPSQNPDFYNWNRVKIRYCDGASFAGHLENEFNAQNKTKLLFRGQLIWRAIMDELFSMGLSKAKEALLSGCSAGALATLIHCDDFREILPKKANVKCLSDAGFFLDENDVVGNNTIESFYRDVVNLHGVAGSLDKDCVAKMEPSKCFFPQQIIKSVKTPVFLVNPAYDFWQIQNILVPETSDPNGSWFRCKLNIHACSPSQIEVLHGFRNSMLKRLSEFQQRKDGGMFINSCFMHCQTWMGETWHAPNSPRINKKTIAESVGDWFFNRREAKYIDCPYPCNPTCIHKDFTQGL